MEALKAVEVSRTYEARKVLECFSLTLEEGAFEALMGPSGSGKSTFMHLAAGLLTPDSGRIEIGGEEITRLSESATAVFRRRHIGVVFQAFNLLEDKNVRDNILLPLRLEGRKAVKNGMVEIRFQSLVRRLGLEELLTKRPHELSGGERQRVAFARALIAEPAVILADEPTGNLDTIAAKEVSSILRELNDAGKSAILVVTHDPQIAACAKRVHFLKGGRIVASFATEHSAARVSQLYLETYA